MNKLVYVVFALTVLGIGAAAAQDRAPDSNGHAPYLALGDSIPFGYNPFLTDLAKAAEGAGTPIATLLPDLLLSYNGYPQDVSELLKLDLTNASCPGQTSNSFLALVPPALDNGCEAWRTGGLPLFVAYTSIPWETQEEYATSFLTEHRDTGLVTITIGGDDLLILLGTTCKGLTGAPLQDCVANYILNTFATNLRDIYAGIRSTGYEGPIVAVNYASPDYTNTDETEAVRALNSALLTVTETFGGRVADAFSAFRRASGNQGLPCAAGVGLAFVNYPSGSGCDVHPTPLGQLVIARLVLKALKEDRFPVGLSRLHDD
jgi:lysophospholipase L1-like esterase